MRQRRDHARLDTMMNRWLAGGPADELEALWRDIVQLVFSHAFAEETVLWPVLRRVAPDGEELTGRVEEEHQAINELVARLAGPGTSVTGAVGNTASALSGERRRRCSFPGAVCQAWVGAAVDSLATATCYGNSTFRNRPRLLSRSEDRTTACRPEWRPRWEGDRSLW
ncbi:hemerythrin domain-containing protein [Streptomyces sp. IPPR8]|uniref:hemerythrin domain-containing protein n=1 Tax=Streptomyces sp. IPPR8 TaxID=3417301 RepID=UPI003D6974A7